LIAGARGNALKDSAMSTMPPPLDLAPITATERMQVMDVLRGFALLGILLMNIEGMVGPLLQAGTGLDPSLAGADRWADAAIYLFVQGKFFTLFSLLFGMGFAVMAERARSRSQDFTSLYLRRSLMLLGIGIVHALLIWSGDILAAYALLSLLLLARPGRRSPQPRLLVGGSRAGIGSTSPVPASMPTSGTPTAKACSSSSATTPGSPPTPPWGPSVEPGATSGT
jgi:uncharacterized membrane protein YeiB